MKSKKPNPQKPKLMKKPDFSGCNSVLTFRDIDECPPGWEWQPCADENVFFNPKKVDEVEIYERIDQFLNGDFEPLLDFVDLVEDQTDLEETD